MGIRPRQLGAVVADLPWLEFSNYAVLQSVVAFVRTHGQWRVRKCADMKLAAPIDISM